MQFSDLVCCPDSLQQLIQLAGEERMPHANLLLAPAGSGGLPAALALATYLLCEEPQAGDSCGRCRACLKTAKWAHPDLHFAFPSVGSNRISDHFLSEWREALKQQPYQRVNDWLQHIGADNKQGNLNKDECAAISKKLSLKIFEGRYKIMLIWLPEYLGNEGNRLLKLIEEPPERTIFLLVTERPERILNTILSRCQLTKLGKPTAEQLSHWLQAKGIAADRAAAAARLADGQVRRALLLAQGEEQGHTTFFLEWMRACHSGSPTRLSDWIDTFAKMGRENQKAFLQYALHFWREYIQLQILGADLGPKGLTPAEVQTAQKMTALIDLGQVGHMSRLIEEAIVAIERNAHPKILMMYLGLSTFRQLHASAAHTPTAAS